MEEITPTLKAIKAEQDQRCNECKNLKEKFHELENKLNFVEFLKLAHEDPDLAEARDAFTLDVINLLPHNKDDITLEIGHKLSQYLIKNPERSAVQIYLKAYKKHFGFPLEGENPASNSLGGYKKRHKSKRKSSKRKTKKKKKKRKKN